MSKFLVRDSDNEFGLDLDSGVRFGRVLLLFGMFILETLSKCRATSCIVVEGFYTPSFFVTRRETPSPDSSFHFYHPNSFREFPDKSDSNFFGWFGFSHLT
jgi:hypothetical protein